MIKRTIFGLAFLVLFSALPAFATFSISGATGVAGATVQYSGFISSVLTTGRVVADGSGNYSITGLSAGTYNVNPYFSGYRFTPGGSSVTITSADVTGVNFTATVIGSSGIWVKKGVMITPTVADGNSGSPTSGTEEPSVMYEGGCLLVTPNADGKCFKLWFAGGINMYYAEANDGLTWTRQAAALATTTGLGNPSVWKNGNTYYLYVSPALGTGKVSVWTSTDGVTFTQAATDIVSPTTVAWELDVQGVVAGTWYGLLTVGAGNAAGGFYSKPITSSDGLAWTFIGGADPLINMFSAHPAVKVGSTYYDFHTFTPYLANASQPFGIPTEMGMSTSTDLIHWTTPVDVLQRTIFPNSDNEGCCGTFGQTGTNPAVVEVNGKTYLYFTVANDGTTGTGFTLDGAVANMPLANVVASNQEAYTLQTTDSFQRADANPIGGNWSSTGWTGFGNAQLISHAVETATIGGNGDSYYNAFTWPNDQYASTTVGAFAAGTYIGVDLRVNPGGSGSGYRCFVGPSGSASFTIQKFVAPNFSTLATTAGTVTTGDVITCTVVGSKITMYKNGLQVTTATDTAIPTGSAGLLVVSSGSNASVSITNWVGGPSPAPPMVQRRR